MNRRTLAILISAICLTANFTLAEDLSKVSVMIYPEYYYAGVMAEVSGEFAETSKLTHLAFQVPATTDSVLQMVSSGDMGQNIVVLPVEKRGKEFWVNLPAKAGAFRVFVFFIPFDDENVKRDFEFSMKFDQALTDVHLIVQKPTAAEKFSLSPPGSEPTKDQHGMELYQYHIDKLAANESRKIVVSYSNPTGETSLERLRKMLNESSGMGSSGSSTPKNVEAPYRHELPLWQPLLVLFCVIGVVGIIYRLYGGKISSNKKGNGFCTSCGTKVNPTDKFCRSCGKKIS